MHKESGDNARNAECFGEQSSGWNITGGMSAPYRLPLRVGHGARPRERRNSGPHYPVLRPRRYGCGQPVADGRGLSPPERGRRGVNIRERRLYGPPHALPVVADLIQASAAGGFPTQDRRNVAGGERGACLNVVRIHLANRRDKPDPVPNRNHAEQCRPSRPVRRSLPG